MVVSKSEHTWSFIELFQKIQTTFITSYLPLQQCGESQAMSQTFIISKQAKHTVSSVERCKELNTNTHFIQAE